MKISKFAILSSLVLASAVAFGQTLPPPDFGGQSYWFGPGPSATAMSSSTQDTGGYSEMSYTPLGGWVVGVTGGPAFVTAGAIPINEVQAVFNVPTTLSIAPYIYIDGYFGVSASVSGFGSTGPVGVGTSRFFVIHNVPIQILAANFSQLSLNGSNLPPFIPATYNFTLQSYAMGPYSDSFAVVAPQSSGGHAFVIDPSTDGSMAQVDIQRLVTPSGTELAGTYEGIGVLVIISL